MWGGGEGGEVGYFQGGGVQEKILLHRGWGGHYMKNKNIGVCVLSTQPDQQKRPECKKCAKMQKNDQTLKNFSSLVSLTRHFNMQNMLLFFFFSFF